MLFTHLWSQPVLFRKMQLNYQRIYELGSGSFGLVILAKITCKPPPITCPKSLLHPLKESHNSQCSLVAIKILSKATTSVASYRKNKEIQFILSVPSHPNLIQVYDLFVDPTTHSIHIVMECMGMSLLQLMSARQHTRFPAQTLKSILAQLLNGLKHIHRNNFCHRDIKPENILVTNTLQFYGSQEAIPPHHQADRYLVKIADYGLSRSVHCTTPFTSYIATRWYRSPEVLLRSHSHSTPADMWAFGVLAVELATFKPLFPGTCELEQLYLIWRVLGSPLLPDITAGTKKSYFIPVGGFWKQSQMLAAKIGIQFPYQPGVSINRLVPESLYSGIQEIVKSCLTWDPDLRADAEWLCSQLYFKATCAYEKHAPSIHNLTARRSHLGIATGYLEGYAEIPSLDENYWTSLEIGSYPQVDVDVDGNSEGESDSLGEYEGPLYVLGSAVESILQPVVVKTSKSGKRRAKPSAAAKYLVS